MFNRFGSGDAPFSVRRGSCRAIILEPVQLPQKDKFYKNKGGESYRIVMRRAKPFFLGFPRKTKGSSQRAMRVVKGPFYFLCVSSLVCIRQHRNRPRRSTAFNADGTNASPDGLCARTNKKEVFSCWSCCKSVRVGRARRGNVCF